MTTVITQLLGRGITYGVERGRGEEFWVAEVSLEVESIHSRLLCGSGTSREAHKALAYALEQLMERLAAFEEEMRGHP